MLNVERATKRYAGVTVLDGVSVEFRAGEVHALVGENGAGKSTLCRILAGVVRPDAGSMTLDGAPYAPASRKDAESAGVRMVMQELNLLPTLTAAQNITLPLELAGRRPDRSWYDHIVAALGLQGRLHHTPAQLSGGQQQRVACARALLGRPEVIFADEPTGNLDSRSGVEVLAFLRRCVRELEQTVVMVTHDPTAASYADEVLLLRDGQLVGRIAQPSADAVLDALRRLDEPGTQFRPGTGV